MRILALLVSALALVGCGSGATSADMMSVVPVDMASRPSACGHPGDKGNSKHVGEYCTMAFGECPTGLTCSVITNSVFPADQQTYFCTIPCTKAGPDPICGENAQCACKAPGCGCTPDVCLAGMAG